MVEFRSEDVHYIEADEGLQQRLAREWGDVAARHMHLVNGFSIVALYQGLPIGLIAVYWRALPPPLSETYEGYIDIIEVREGFRRQGIARKMIDLSLEQAKKQRVYQVRAWSSDDKTEAISMWKALGFALCPATVYPKGDAVKGYFAINRL